MEDEQIISAMLMQLDGWILDNAENENVPSTRYNKKVTADELLHYYNVATDYAKAYTDRTDFDTIPISDTSITLWGAGLIWNKYNIRVNNQIDDDNPFGFGDKLIIQAKEMLKPYKSYELHSW